MVVGLVEVASAVVFVALCAIEDDGVDPMDVSSAVKGSPRLFRE